MSEVVTILRTVPTPAGAPRYATKRWAWNLTTNDWRKVSYEAGASFTAHERPVSSLADVAELLEKVRRDPRAFVVRGDLLPEARALAAENPQHRFRRAKKAGKQGQAPTLAEVPRRWLMIDVDGWPLPTWGDLADDPASVIEHAIAELLPEPFHDVACWWQLSSSAGFVAGVLKAHLFFWLSEPVSNEDLKLYLQVHAPAVDRAPFNAAQPHYIADPIIEGGHDPLPTRTGWVKGLEEEVVLPALDLAALRAQVQARRERVATGAGLDPSAARTVAGALTLLGDEEGREGWHAPLRRATLLYARTTPPQSRDDEAMKRLCREAIETAATREAGRHAAADLARFTSDAYLDALLEGAFDWLEANRREVPEGVAPHHEAPGFALDDARRAVRDHIGDFLHRAAVWTGAAKGTKPPHVGVAVDVGAGKSREARRAVVEWVQAAKAAEQNHRVLWLNPTTKLNMEAEAALIEAGATVDVTVAVHRGRERDDPLTPGEAMCLDLEAVKLATSAGESVEKAVCGDPKKAGPVCPFREVCGYYRQTPAVEAADVVLAAHEAGFHSLPGKIKKRLSLTVFDEAFWQDGIKTKRTIPLSSLTDGLGHYPVLKRAGGGRQVVDDDATADLIEARTKLRTAMEKAPDGYVRREDLLAVRLTAAECGTSRGAEWNRRREGLMRPGMAPDDRRRAAEEAGVNAQLPRWAAMWDALAGLLDGGEEATGRAEVLWRPDRDGKPERCLSLNTIASLVDAIHEAPALLLDATMPADLVKAYLPRLEVAEAVRVKAPHMEVRQVRGGWGKTTLLPNRLRIARDAETGTLPPLPSTLAELRDFIRSETQGERSLVITYKDAEAAFLDLPGVEVAHFNDVAGRDEWKDVRHLFVIGRPRPRSDEVRVLAAALTGKPVEVAESQRETRGVRLTGGGSGTVEVRAYANPAAEAVSAAITDAEVVQAIGRARGINRGEQDPVRIWLLADVVTPLLVDELLDWRDLAPGAVERMAMRGIFLASPADAAKAYPDLFSTPKAAEHALKRAGVGGSDFPPISLRKNTLRGMGGKCPLRFSYRPKGRGQQTRQGWARFGTEAADLWEWLQGRLGELALFEIEQPPSESPPPRPCPPSPSDAPAEAFASASDGERHQQAPRAALAAVGVPSAALTPSSVEEQWCSAVEEHEGDLGLPAPNPSSRLPRHLVRSAAPPPDR